MRTVMKHKHRDNCWSVEEVKSGKWDAVWGVVDTMFANKHAHVTPKRRGYVYWLVLKCNDPQCNAETWVLADDFYKLVGNA